MQSLLVPVDHGVTYITHLLPRLSEISTRAAFSIAPVVDVGISPEIKRILTSHHLTSKHKLTCQTLDSIEALVNYFKSQVGDLGTRSNYCLNVDKQS